MPSSDFPTTRWSVLTALGNRPEEAQRGLAYLCESYWYPVYAFIRAQGHDRPASEDLTQTFFANLIEKERFTNISPERGRFRSYLLAAVKHFLSNERDRQRTQKRGGGVVPLSLDFASAEHRYRLDPPETRTPETVYEEHWARMLLEQALGKLHGEFVKAGKAVQFQAYRPYLLDPSTPSYAETAARLTMTEGAVKTGVHRLRQRFGEVLRALIKETVRSQQETEEELRYLIGLLNGSS